MALVNTVPTLALYQEFTKLPSALTDSLRACIIGPHYYLCRFDNSAEKALGLLGNYDLLTDTEYVWPNKPAGAVADLVTARILVENANLQYFHDEISDASIIQATARNKVRAQALVWKTANGYSRSSVLRSRDVQVGDKITITGIPEGEDPIEFSTTVAGFEYETAAAVLPSTATSRTANKATTISAASATKLTGFSNVTPTALATTFDALAYGEVSETYVITCTKAMTGSDIATAKFSATSASGKDNVSEIIVSAFSTAVEFGNFKARFSLASSGSPTIAVGDSFRITVSQAYTAPTVTVSGSYIGAEDMQYIVTFSGLVGSQAVFNVTTTDGKDASGPHIAAIETPVEVGSYGVTIEFDVLPCPGDMWYISATAEKDAQCRTLVLNQSMPAELYAATDSSGVSYSGGTEIEDGDHIDLDVVLSIVSTVELTATDFTATVDAITVKGGLSSYDSSWYSGSTQLPLPIIAGDVYVDYRALRVDYSYGRSTLSDASEVESVLGPAVAANPLALGVYKALENSSGVEVGFVAVPTNDLAGYNLALEAIEDTFNAYGVVPLSQDTAIQAAVKAHVLAQSAAVRKRFRICWLNSVSGKLASVSTLNTAGAALTATIEDNTNTVSTDYTVVVASTGKFITDGVRAGDLLRTAYQPDGSFTSYVIDSVESEDRLILKTGPSAAVTVAQKIEVWRSRTATEEATAYAAKSSAFNDRRVRHIWPDVCETTEGETVEGFYLCCGLAGLRSAIAPHRPMSKTTLTGFANVSRSFVDMKESHLDIIARGGTWILTQDSLSGAVYTRLAVTTDVSDLNHSQDSRTTNVDSVMFGFYARLNGLTGTSNITPRLMSYIKTQIESTISYFKSSSKLPDLGPQILDATISSGPTQDEAAKDTVNVEIDGSFPYELGRLNLTLYVS